jgi:hypothetical protein
MKKMMTVAEPSRNLPVWADVDVCVIGGSCTGVFAAVRAARLGASIALVERSNCFGGTATNGLVLIWHSPLDTEFRKPIISGLTQELVDRLVRRNAGELKCGSSDSACRLNTEELKIELDLLVQEHRIQPMLHTLGCWPLMDGDRITAVAVENKDGRGAIRARVFVDATGDGDIAVRAGVPHFERDHVQPPTTCAKIRNFRQDGVRFAEIYRAHHTEFGLVPDSGWDSHIPGVPDIAFVAQTHVFGLNLAHAAQLTQAEIEGRRQIRRVIDMLCKYGTKGNDIALVQLASAIGIRETRVVEAAHCLTEDEVLHGVRFPDAIANGSYRVDVHAPDGGGFLFKYLDGRTVFAHGNGNREGRWREPTPANPTFYQIPYRCLFHPSRPNLLCAGRMIHTDRGAFGAIRVMVNTNQTGEAAGVAAVLALRGNGSVAAVDPTALRRALADGGSIML